MRETFKNFFFPYKFELGNIKYLNLFSQEKKEVISLKRYGIYLRNLRYLRKVKK